MDTATQLLTEHLNTWTASVQVKSSAGRGGGSKRELYGIKKLRELILELAVRGLLVPQDPNDEPAVELLKEIEAKQAELIKHGKLKKPKKLPAVSADEIPFQIPSSWKWCRLSQLANPQAGFAFKSKDFNESEVGLPLIRIRDVGQQFSGTYFSGDYREEFIVEHGDYLISMDGIFRVAAWELQDALLNQRVTRLQFYHDSIPQDLIAKALQIELSKLQGVKAYTTVDHLSGKQISNAVIPLPPLAEQNRIVAKVDELMALCDRLEQAQSDHLDTHETLVATLLDALIASASDAEHFQQAWQRIAENFDALFTTEASIDQLKQSILQLAVMGKLVPQDPNDEPASVCFDKIEKDKKNSHLKATKIDKEATPASIHIPGTWLRLQLGEVASIRTGFAFKSKDYQDVGTFILRVTNINPDGSFDQSDSVFLPDSLLDKKMEGFLLTEGELLVVMVGGSLGKIGRVTERILPALLNQNMWRLLSYSENYNADFLHLVLRDLNENRLKITSSTHGHLAMGVYAASFIPLPPLAEQHRIVAKVDELMALCDALKAKLQAAQTTQLQLTHSLVEQAIH